MKKNKRLIVVVGPTAVGKTALCVALGKDLSTEVVSADSRQFYREMSVGTAKPSVEERQGVPHHFIDSLHISEPYDVARFEEDAIQKIGELHQKSPYAILAGGSGLFVKAVCEGLADMPDVPEHFREEVTNDYKQFGLEALQEELKSKDPIYHAQVALDNPQRLMRAIEFIRATGEPFSSYRVPVKKERAFDIVKIGLTMDRQTLYERIDRRMDDMLANGLEAEAALLYPHKELNALQTVGYKEIFGYMEGLYDREEAVTLLKRNSRRYAKRQMTWFGKDADIRWFHPSEYEAIKSFAVEGLMPAPNKR